MATGALIVAASFALIAGVCLVSDAHHARSSWIWLFGFWAVLTIGELFILPVGLGLFGRLAPKGFEATAIAIWFFAGFVGNLFAGWLGSLWSRLSQPAFFAVIAMTSIAAALMLLPFVRPTARAEAGEGL
jgi:POT family proton-dependent oligopeptide transporter